MLPKNIYIVRRDLSVIKPSHTQINRVNIFLRRSAAVLTVTGLLLAGGLNIAQAASFNDTPGGFAP
jgi:hypothetical protein